MPQLTRAWYTTWRNEQLQSTRAHSRLERVLDTSETDGSNGCAQTGRETTTDAAAVEPNQLNGGTERFGVRLEAVFQKWTAGCRF